jgi:hypothetical protein
MSATEGGVTKASPLAGLVEFLQRKNFDLKN